MDEKTTPTGQQTSIERKADVKFFDPSRWAQVEDLSSSGSVIQTQMLAEMIEKKIKDALGVEFKVGIWDEGSVRSSHQELNGRVTLKDSSAQLSDHSTHVAGTIADSLHVHRLRCPPQ